MTNISKLVHIVFVPKFSIVAQVETHVQGAIEVERQEEKRTKELDLTTKPKDQLTIQTLVTFLRTATPSQALHILSVEATPLQPSQLSPTTSKVDKVTSFGDVNQDEVIVLTKFDLATITIEQISILQDAFAKKSCKNNSQGSLGRNKHCKT